MLMFCFPVSAFSQSAPLVPKYTLFGGYTIVRNQFLPPPGSTFDIKGWEASIERKVAPWIGIVADASQQYGIRSGENQQQTIVLFGPQVSPHVSRRVIPFAHFLIGAVVGAGFNFGSGGATFSHGFGSVAKAVGGGVDIKVFGPLWIRPIQADYLPSGHIDDDHKTKARISSGIALRL